MLCTKHIGIAARMGQPIGQNSNCDTTWFIGRLPPVSGRSPPIADQDKLPTMPPSQSRPANARCCDDPRLGSLQFNNVAADAKLIQIVRPPLCHLNPFLPMSAAMIRRSHSVAVFMGKRSLDCIGRPFAGLIQ